MRDDESDTAGLSARGWTALCPLCDSETRISISRFLKIDACPNGHTPVLIKSEIDNEELPGLPVSQLLLEELSPPLWLVSPYLLEKSIVVLAGPPGSGKTLLAFDWAAQCVRAGKKVFVGENEGSKYSLQQRFRRSCAAAGLQILPKTFRFQRNLDLPLANLVRVQLFAESLTSYDLIILDSLSSFCPGLNENDAEQMGIIAEGLKIICEVTGSTVIALHHTTKISWKPGERPSLDAIRGHSTLHGRIDTGLAVVPLERLDGVVRFELWMVKQRDEDWARPREYSIAMKGNVAKVEHHELEQSGSEAPTEKVRALFEPVLAVVPYEGAGHGMTKTEILEAVTGRDEHIREAIKLLTQSGKLKHVGKLYIRARNTEKQSDSKQSRPSRDPRDPERDDEND